MDSFNAAFVGNIGTGSAQHPITTVPGIVTLAEHKLEQQGCVTSLYIGQRWITWLSKAYQPTKQNTHVW